MVFSRLLRPVVMAARPLTLARSKTHFRSGALKPLPESVPFGLVGIFCTVIPGLLVGAAISKNVANFLEENELFVPDEEEDD
ncbi:essential MCU regulator, mitochondrial-like [Phlebotomus argentipes]|uniref:essential MCU regulator, mitochondrial-like n=1 Tax=Phlebotomus argentipes TaxID=94469 RepID=UPI002892B1D4|nr:essential MCU regulator, mitochondrial-like [Phlebotomus argentipes]